MFTLFLLLDTSLMVDICSPGYLDSFDKTRLHYFSPFLRIKEVRFIQGVEAKALPTSPIIA
jgi:hypothetical protein